MEIAVVFLPLLGAFIAGFFGRFIGDRGAQAVTIAGVGAAAVLSIILFVDVAVNGGHQDPTNLFTWIDVGGLDVSWSLRVDTLTAVMLVVVTVVSSMVHVYSVGYMSHDPSKPRFMAYLSLFTFMMLMLVTADNLLQLFFGWEGVGLASYLLIGFWYERPSANAAAIKAFVVNRVGDFGFILGIFALYVIFGTIQFDGIFDNAQAAAGREFTFLGWQGDALTIACLLLFVGAMGKSAQLGLHTWLPDAMEGPTPVSALIHAATMVTAGVFLVARMSPVFELAPDALTVVTIVGALTAFVAATIGVTQTDIKRVIAYSTMSQLGYMFFALGVGAYGAAIFHLMTHAFFKALLFLGAGSVIHALSDEQDMRNMGGVWKMIPATYALMWVGSLALMGFPPLAGYYSKDFILEAAWLAHTPVGSFAFWMGLAAAFLTAFYSSRLMFMTFHGKPRANDHVMAHVHESPAVMIGPLVVLAIGAVVAGFWWFDAFVGGDAVAFWNGSIALAPGEGAEEHHVEAWVLWAPVAVGVLGLALAWFLYVARPGLPAKLAGAMRPLYLLSFNKWYFDLIYDRIFVRPAHALGVGFWKGGDQAIIDGFGPNGVAAVTQQLSGVARRLQTGYVFHYAFAMLVGVVLLVSWYLYGPTN